MKLQIALCVALFIFAIVALAAVYANLYRFRPAKVTSTVTHIVVVDAPSRFCVESCDAQTLNQDSTGSGNIAVGYQASASVMTGSDNIGVPPIVEQLEFAIVSWQKARAA